MKHRSIKMGEKEEEDYGALIYRESQLRKAEAATAAATKDAKKKKKKKAADALTRRRAASTRATPAIHSKPAVTVTRRTRTLKRKRELSPDNVKVAPRRVNR